MSAEVGEDRKADENVSETPQEDKDKSPEDINENDENDSSTLKSSKNELEDEWVDILGSGQLRKRVSFSYIA
jgi:hypothetical protein